MKIEQRSGIPDVVKITFGDIAWHDITDILAQRAKDNGWDRKGFYFFGSNSPAGIIHLVSFRAMKDDRGFTAPSFAEWDNYTRAFRVFDTTAFIKLGLANDVVEIYLAPEA